MAVKQCLECGGEVDRWERTCPHCGTTQAPLVTRLLLAFIVLAAGFVAWQSYFPKITNTRVKPGTPVLTRPQSPICETAEKLDVYLKLLAKEDRTGMERLRARGGCILVREDIPLTVLVVESTGIVLVQGFSNGHAANFWISEQDLKPYRAK